MVVIQRIIISIQMMKKIPNMNRFFNEWKFISLLQAAKKNIHILLFKVFRRVMWS